MKTTKRIIKNRLMKDDSSLTEQQAQEFVDGLFPDMDMDTIVETEDDLEDEAVGNIGQKYYE